jgi:hypothetical protein
MQLRHKEEQVKALQQQLFALERTRDRSVSFSPLDHMSCSALPGVLRDQLPAGFVASARGIDGAMCMLAALQRSWSQPHRRWKQAKAKSENCVVSGRNLTR